MGEVNPDEPYDWEYIFEAFDENKDGGISALEIESLMKKMGLVVTKKESRDIVNFADRKGKGMIDKADFVEFMENKHGGINSEMKKLFDRLDSENLGYLPPETLRKGMVEFHCNVTDEDFEKILKLVDSEDQGKIYFDDFLKAIK